MSPITPRICLLQAYTIAAFVVIASVYETYEWVYRIADFSAVLDPRQLKNKVTTYHVYRYIFQINLQVDFQ